MDRREALRYTGWIAGAGLLAPGVLAALQSCRNAPEEDLWKPQALTNEQVDQLTLLSDTIVPATDTPSASGVRVHQFVDLLIADVLTDDQGRSITEGLQVLDDISRDQTGNSFEDLIDEDRVSLLKEIDTNAFADQPSEVYDASFLTNYRYIKGLILMAYFTSEEGVKQNLNYVVTPGEYKGCIDLPEDGKVMIGNHM